MVKRIKHYLINITPLDRKHISVFESKTRPVVTNDFIHLELMSELGVTSKGFNLRDIAEYAITAVEE